MLAGPRDQELNRSLLWSSSTSPWALGTFGAVLTNRYRAITRQAQQRLP
jgi:hypothetical protein